MDSLAVTDHGNLHAAWSFYEEAKAQKHPADPRLRGLPRVRPAHRAREAAGRPGRLQPSGPARQEPRRLPQPDPALLHRISPRGSTAGPGSTRRCWSSTPRASSASPPASRARSRSTSGREGTRRRSRAPSGSPRLFGNDGFWLEVQQHGIPEEQVGHRGHAPAGRRSSGSASSRPTTRTISGGKTPKRTTCCSPSAPAATSTTPSGSASPAQESYVKSEKEMRALFPGPARDARQHAGGRRPLRVRFREAVLPARSSPAPPSTPTDEALLEDLAAQRRRARATARRCPTPVEERLDYELGVINTAGYAGYFLIVQDFIAAARDRGIPVGPGPRLGRRLARRLRARHHQRRPAQVRPPLRAVPEPRAGVDARHRRRLLLRAPGRGDRVRAGALRPARAWARSSPSGR